MSNTANWVEKFQIADSLKAEYEKSGANQQSFLVWCLEHGHVNETEYLSWASNEFQIPIVSESFFSNEEAKTKWRASWITSRFLHQWNPSLLPLDENSEVVRVGCVEVPELKLEKTTAFVLAPLSGLKSLWSEAFPQVQQTQGEEQTRPAVSAELPPPAPPQEADANSLMASWGTFEEEPSPETSELPEVPATEEEPAQMPEGFSASVADIDIPIPVFSKKSSDEPKSSMAPPPPLPPVVEQPTEQTLTSLPPTPEVVEASAPTPIVEVRAKNPPIPPMAAGLKTANDAIGMVELRNPKDNFSECSSLSELAVAAFAKFSRYFDRHLLITQKGFEFRPNIWAGNWQLRSVNPSQINIEQPGIFRIVSRTGLPYHGYIKPSAVNDLFFAEWNGGSTPAHVTVMPILNDNQLVGMLIGVTDGSLDPKVALTDAERWLRELTPHFLRLKAAQPKAA